MTSPRLFSLSAAQQERFLKVFNEKKAELIKIEQSIGGAANRLGIITYRVLMIISVLRVYETGSFDKKNEALDEDFETAMMIIARGEVHTKNVFKYIDTGLEVKDLVLNLRKKGISMPKIEKVLNVNRGRIPKWCKRLNTVKNCD